MKSYKFGVLILLLVFFTAQLKAQAYQTAIGARLGYPLALSVKHFVNESAALEGYLGTRGWSGYRWTNISGAYLVHKPLNIPNVEVLQWYFGGGASLFFWNFRDNFFGGDTYANTSIGIQGYLGLDLTLRNTPINFTVDWVPTYFFNGFGSGFGGGYGSLGIRYVLSR